MTALIRIGRRVKSLFFKLKLHVVLEPLVEVLIKLAYLSKLSRWCSQHTNLPFQDSANPKFNYAKRYELYEFVLESENLGATIDYLEFGVGTGKSFKWWLEHNTHPDSRFVGFDTFIGLPEGWGSLKQGTFSTDGEVPATNDSRAMFKAGLFQETLRPFLREFGAQKRKVIHLDADLYSSTLFVLTSLAHLLQEGDILLFDEFGVPTHEFKAFTEFVTSYGVQYEVLGAVNNYLQVAIKVRG
ncbi:MAG: class I SAM-dependent methyltransferase [bacterium]